MIDQPAFDDSGRRAFELLDDGQLEDAAELFRKNLELYPYSPDLYAGLGQAYGEMGEFVMSARALSQGLKLSPGDEEMIFGLGLCLLKLNRLEEAEACFARIDDAVMTDLDALLHLAFAYYQAERPGEAADYCRRALDEDPDSAEALALLGVCLRELGENREEMHQCFLKAIDLEPERWDWIEYYGNLLYEEGDRERALLYLDSVPLEELSTPDSLRRLAKLLKKSRLNARKVRDCRKRAKQVAASESFEHFIYSLQEGV